MHGVTAQFTLLNRLLWEFYHNYNELFYEIVAEIVLLLTGISYYCCQVFYTVHIKQIRCIAAAQSDVYPCHWLVWTGSRLTSAYTETKNWQFVDIWHHHLRICFFLSHNNVAFRVSVFVPKPTIRDPFFSSPSLSTANAAGCPRAETRCYTAYIKQIRCTAGVQSDVY